ncbi:hypothetical protein AHAS_Ahas01G0049000 [Arachis hypogaea]
MNPEEEAPRERTYANIVAGNNPEIEDDSFSSEDDEMQSDQQVVPKTEHAKIKSQEKQAEKLDITVEEIGKGLFNIIINEAAKTELRKPCIDVIDLGNDFYLAKFYAQEDMDHALLDVPWKIYDHYLAIRIEETKSPDPGKGENTKQNLMETDLQQYIQNLIKDVDFEMPVLDDSGHKDAADMRLN